MTMFAQMADIHLPIEPGTDVVLLNALAHVILRKGLPIRPISMRLPTARASSRHLSSGTTRRLRRGSAALTKTPSATSPALMPGPVRR